MSTFSSPTFSVDFPGIYISVLIPPSKHVFSSAYFSTSPWQVNIRKKKKKRREDDWRGIERAATGGYGEGGKKTGECFYSKVRVTWAFRFLFWKSGWGRPTENALSFRKVFCLRWTSILANYLKFKYVSLSWNVSFLS